jgi:hypothetical protein
MTDDPLARIADSYKTIADTQQTLAQTQQRLEATQHFALRTLRGLAWLQGLAGVLLGLALVGLGALLWLSLTQGQEHAAQTRALLELLQRSHP